MPLGETMSRKFHSVQFYTSFKDTLMSPELEQTHQAVLSVYEVAFVNLYEINGS